MNIQNLERVWNINGLSVMDLQCPHYPKCCRFKFKSDHKVMKINNLIVLQ